MPDLLYLSRFRGLALFDCYGKIFRLLLFSNFTVKQQAYMR